MTAEVSRRSDARDNRRRILAAAREAFAAEGPDVPVREIARRADVAPATVYRHFPSKPDLFAEALSLHLCSQVVEQGLQEEDPWRGFSLVVGELIRTHAANDVTQAYLGRRAEVFDRDRTKAVQGMARLIGRAKAAGALRRDFALADVALALRATTALGGNAPATERFTTLMLRSFSAPAAATPPAPAPPAAPASP